MRARLLPLFLLASSGCASSRPVQPITFGSPELFGAGITRATKQGEVTFALDDIAHVILLRVHPMSGIDTYLPALPDSAFLPGTHRVQVVPLARARSFEVPVSGALPANRLYLANCGSGTRETQLVFPQPGPPALVDANRPEAATEARMSAAPMMIARPETRLYYLSCRTPASMMVASDRPNGEMEPRGEGYLLLIVSDVASDPVRLRQELRFVAIERDSIGVALPTLAEALVGTRTRRWAAYALAPRQ